MGGAVIKFPQIIKVLAKKSVFGISFTSVILEVFYLSTLVKYQHIGHWILHLQRKSIQSLR